LIHSATFQVDGVFQIEGRGTVATGELTSGLLKRGMKAVVNGKQTEVMELETFNKKIDLLEVGIAAGVLLSNLEKTDVSKGNIYFE
jgi:elongation factor Tu